MRGCLLFFLIRLLLEKQTPQPQRPPHIPQIHKQRVEALVLYLLLFTFPEIQPAGRIQVAEGIGCHADAPPGDLIQRIAVDALLTLNQALGLLAQ